MNNNGKTTGRWAVKGEPGIGLGTALVRLFLAVCLVSGLYTLLFGIPKVTADDGGTGRFKEVQTTYTQYTWLMTSKTDNHIICQVILYHEGIPTTTEALSVCQDKLFPTPVYPTPEGGGPTPIPPPQPTPSPEQITEALDNINWVLASKQEVVRTEKIRLPNMIVNLYAPPEPVPQPYVILKAVEPVEGYSITGVFGTIGGRPFECPGSECVVYLQQDVRITYWATSSYGDESQHASATIRVTKPSDLFVVEITERTGFTQYSDYCSRVWGPTAYGLTPKWSFVMQSPEELHTEKDLHYLATKLIARGLVDTKDCPDKGLFAGNVPNACGIEKAHKAMVEWQNRFDPFIWNASIELGVPPVMIKSLIEQESQFWPENARFVYAEYGLGQINELGADVALRWDHELNSSVCSSLLFDCGLFYASQPSYAQILLRGGLIQQMDVSCPKCKYGFDLAKAERSVGVITQTLRANCRQTGYILQNESSKAEYDDIWKFTLLSYHGGYTCLEDAVKLTNLNHEPMDWAHVASHISCPNTKEYVDNLWGKLKEFKPFVPPIPIAAPIPILPTPTPSPTPGLLPGQVKGRIFIILYQDANGNRVMDPNEGVNDIEVNVQFADGSMFTKRSKSGEIRIDFTRQQIGSTLLVTIPYLNKSIQATVPENGEVFIVSRLLQPYLPHQLP